MQGSAGTECSEQLSSMQSVFPLLCCPPVHYFIELLRAEEPVVDLGEHFVKQTNRNRFEIAGPNGRQRLSVHIAGSKGNAEPQERKKLFDDGWNRQMIRTLHTAYNSSAYYIHYGAEIEDILNDTHSHLLHLNLELFKALCGFLELNPFPISESYVEGEVRDLRHHFKKAETIAIPVYRQVFDDRHGFLNNLSILDLIFNLGPAASDYLHKAIK